MEITEKTTGRRQPATLLQACDSDLQQLKLRVGTDRTVSTYTRQCRLRQLVADFLKEVLATDDIALQDLNTRFIFDYSAYLSSRRHMLPGTVWLACQWLKGVVGRASQRGWMVGNPFAEFHAGRNIRPREYLTESELQQLMALHTDDRRYALYRDLFVFSALTGLSFADINSLSQADIRTVGGQQWIMALRHKTGTPYQVRLMPQVAAIISRHDRGTGRIFGPITYRTMAKHIPLLMQQLGIARHVTFHSARHTFAIMCLNAGVPIESISRMLGHTNISTTQIYARITLGKLNSDIDSLQQFLETNWKY